MDRFFDRFFDDELGIPLALPPPPSPVGLDTSGELLCLDVGMRRTGVAVTQFVAGDVHALRVLHHPPRRAGGEQRMQALQDDIAYLERAIADHNVAGLVVGWPLEPRSGQPGVQCERVRSYVVRLQQAALLMSDKSEAFARQQTSPLKGWSATASPNASLPLPQPR